jgi:hypothetical protein
MTRRRWYQIHLSTAIVALLVTSLFLYLNVRRAKTDEQFTYTRYSRGWPLRVMDEYEIERGRGASGAPASPNAAERESAAAPKAFQISLNVVVGCLIVLLFARAHSWWESR